MLTRCNTFSVESQLQSKRLRWLGHMFRMHVERLPKKLLFGQVKGRRPPGCPRSSFNDVAVRDCQLRRITKPYKDAQNRLLWRDKTCLTRTWLVMSWKALLLLLLFSLCRQERHAAACVTFQFLMSSKGVWCNSLSQLKGSLSVSRNCKST